MYFSRQIKWNISIMGAHSENFTNIFGFNVFSSTLEVVDAEERQVLLNTFSPNSYGIALKDKAFEVALKNTDYLVLDGMGIAIGSLLLHGKNIKKIAGQDCFDFFMAKANERHWRVFFMGSSTQTLEKIIKRASREYPNIELASYSPPFKPEFSREDNNEIVRAINDFNAHVVFVGLTAPKQEKWAYEHKNLLNTKVISTIGNVFDWYAGNSKRPANIWIKLRLEWFVRIFLRPEILKRNTGNQMKFFKDLLLHVLYIKRIKA